MKVKILGLLENSLGKFISGEEISISLGVSRTAVWKHIQSLREDGYEIESQTRIGYRLLSLPDLLHPWEIRRGLDTRVFGSKIIYFKQVSSTNDAAREEAEAGSPEGTVVIAEAQEKGRGRLGRSWVSSYGKGLWVSMIIRPEISPARAARLTMLAAVAVAIAVQETTGLMAGIKWPNDILIGTRKVCGILTEMKAETDTVHYIIMGIGINVNQEEKDFPSEIGGVATSLSLCTGNIVPRVKLLQCVLRNLESTYEEFKKSGFQPILERWKELNITLGQQVTVTTFQDSFTGTAVDVLEDGALVVQGDDGIKRVFQSGDVSVRSRN
ncbi:MAG: biotin--[acetyl-CoA-carboxylase] ligase [Bacillota bacterium]